MAVDQATAARLVKLLGMMGSDHDGEVINAAKAAHRLLQSRGLTWSDVVTVESAPEQDQPGIWREPQCWRDAVGICLGLTDAPLSAWDKAFLIGISGRKVLTEKQKCQLDRIVDMCRFYARMAA
jgi:hypothetical protein